MKAQPNMKPRLEKCTRRDCLGFRASINGVFGFGHSAAEALAALTVALMFGLKSY